uniref:Uncharacterized protein n=1 Tax=Knipowitschia caucasica TaxID=637954 RepID=A0AAV2L5Z9_KNICA
MSVPGPPLWPCTPTCPRCLVSCQGTCSADSDGATASVEGQASSPADRQACGSDAPMAGWDRSAAAPVTHLPTLHTIATESNSEHQLHATCTSDHLNVLLGNRTIGKTQSPCLRSEGDTAP